MTAWPTRSLITIATASSGSTAKLVPWREAKLHVLTHALHYASAVFEGERAYGGEIFKLTEHTERLYDSARILDFEIPYSVAEIDQACRDVVEANKLVGLLRAPDRLARQREDGRLGAGDQDPSRHRGLGLGLLFPDGAAPQGHPPDIAEVSPARSATRAGQEPRRPAST